MRTAARIDKNQVARAKDGMMKLQDIFTKKEEKPEGITAQQAKTAAAWWTDQIRTPSFDNGDDSESGSMGMILGVMLADKQKPDAGKYDEFEAALCEAIKGEHPRLWLDVDYHPGGILAEVAQSVGIAGSQFPWKTSTWFRDGGVQVSKGYHGEVEDIPLVELAE